MPTIKLYNTPAEFVTGVYNIWTFRGEHALTLDSVQAIVSHLLSVAAENKANDKHEECLKFIEFAEVVSNLYHLGKCASKKFQRNFRLE